jgi:hypothetical protein
MNAPLDADDALAREVLGAIQPPMPLAAPPLPIAEPPAEPASEPEPEKLPEFDPRHRTEFEGLLFLGRLQETVPFLGHRFRLVTPSSAERLQMALLQAPYQETVGAEYAYACAMVAAFLIEVDGKPLPQPITNDPKDTALEQRWDWVLNNLRRPVVEHLFNECFRLDGQVREILDAMGKASG